MADRTVAVRVRRDGALRFVGRTPAGLEAAVDARASRGGAGSAPGNTELLLTAVAGCLSMDLARSLGLGEDEALEVAVTARVDTSEPTRHRLADVALDIEVPAGRGAEAERFVAGPTATWIVGNSLAERPAVRIREAPSL